MLMFESTKNQNKAETRLIIFLELPIRHKEIIYEPALQKIYIEKYL